MKQLPAHSILIENYSGIVWFPYDSVALLFGGAVNKSKECQYSYIAIIVSVL